MSLVVAGKSSRRLVVAAIARAVALLLVTFIPLRPVWGQVVPNDDWKTIETQHFRVHFTPQLEVLARHSAANAERCESLRVLS